MSRLCTSVNVRLYSLWCPQAFSHDMLVAIGVRNLQQEGERKQQQLHHLQKRERIEKLRLQHSMTPIYI